MSLHTSEIELVSTVMTNGNINSTGRLSKTSERDEHKGGGEKNPLCLMLVSYPGSKCSWKNLVK